MAAFLFLWLIIFYYLLFYKPKGDKKMDKRHAKRLANNDQVQVRSGKNWINGYVVGDVRVTPHGIFVSAITEEGYQHEIRHSDLR